MCVSNLMILFISKRKVKVIFTQYIINTEAIFIFVCHLTP